MSEIFKEITNQEQWSHFDLTALVDSNETHYYQADVIDNKFTIRSTLAEKWINERRNIIVLDNVSGGRMLLTPFDLSVDAVSDNVFKRNWQEGKFATLTIDFTPGIPVLPVTEKSKWLEILMTRFNYSWINMLKEYFASEEFRSLNNKLNTQIRKTKQIWPVKELTYRMFGFRTDTLRVIFLGQDCYSNSHANGIAFATDQLSKPVSLRSIEKAVQKDLNYDISWSIQNNLLNVVKQGVYFLNCGFTCEFNNSGSLLEEWKPFTTKIIQNLNRFEQPLIFILLGKQAQSFQQYIGEKHFVYSVEHPSYASRQEREWNHENVFLKVNEKLKELGTPILKW